jgi:UDP-glucose 4-epimerase
VDSYRRTFDLDARVVRPFNNYGPRQNAGTYAGIIPIVIDRLSRGLPIEIFGDGKQTRDFTFVRDSAAAILKIAQLDALPFSLPLNVATGQETTILSLVKKIAESMNLAEPEFHFKQERIGDVRRHCADTSAFSDLLGYSIEPISVPKLAETAEWYLAK